MAKKARKTGGLNAQGKMKNASQAATSTVGSIHCASLVLTYTLFILLLFHVAVSTGADDTVNIAAILDVTTPAGKAANKSLHFSLQDVNDGAATGTRLNLTIQES
ncbi:hypothetical protein SUGI_0802590 [Cryptomeria japonica]|nr:hypothetical protein SUGI_0802590 [Cryptomeria japonica]